MTSSSSSSSSSVCEDDALLERGGAAASITRLEDVLVNFMSDITSRLDAQDDSRRQLMDTLIAESDSIKSMLTVAIRDLSLTSEAIDADERANNNVSHPHTSGGGSRTNKPTAAAKADFAASTSNAPTASLPSEDDVVVKIEDSDDDWALTDMTGFLTMVGSMGKRTKANGFASLIDKNEEYTSLVKHFMSRATYVDSGENVLEEFDSSNTVSAHPFTLYRKKNPRFDGFLLAFMNVCRTRI
ncbi:MAG TPA: hypothetical protein VFQ26_06180 [Nitrospiraceae bacterium]|nr:hypothetical protein [Nitrospiraceae bacterium]